MPTTFADAVPIQQLAPNQYSVQLADNWCIGTVPNGGYITSAFQIAARTHMQLTHASRSQPHVVNLHLEFLRRTSAGPALFTIRDVKLGARISNLHLTLSQKASLDATAWTDEVEGYITMSNISSEEGLSLPTSHSLLPSPVPVSLSDLSSNSDTNYALRAKDPFSQFRRGALNLQMHLVRPDRKPSSHPKAMIDQWVRFTPLSNPGEIGRWTNDSLGFVVDMFPQIIESYVNPVVEEAVVGKNLSSEEIKEIIKTNEPKAKYWYPTLVLNLDVKKLLPEEGVEWLFVRVQAKKIENGRFDLNVEVLDMENELVAISSHASLVVDASRNTAKRGQGKKSKL